MKYLVASSVALVVIIGFAYFFHVLEFKGNILAGLAGALSFFTTLDILKRKEKQKIDNEKQKVDKEKTKKDDDFVKSLFSTTRKG